MARRKRKTVLQDNTVQYVRGVLVYLCILTLFGTVILLVQAGMEEKRIRYEISDRITEKRVLMDEIRKLDNQVAEKENFERISALVNEQLPHLGPPQHPAISIPVSGLQEIDQALNPVPASFDKDNWLNRMRKQWRNMESQLNEYLNQLVE